MMVDGRPTFGETEFFKKTYNEAISIVHQAADYFETRGFSEKEKLNDEATLTYTAESLRMTTRLTQIMAWLFVQRAIAAGELKEDEAREPNRRLGGHATCLPDDPIDTEGLPADFMALLSSSEGLFRRVSRLDQMVARDAA